MEKEAHSNWVSLVQVVPKKSGIIVTKNQHDEMVPTRIQNSWRVCIDYRKLNQATRKDHFPLPFLDQILEKLAGKSHYCFLDGYFGRFIKNFSKMTLPLSKLLQKDVDFVFDEASVEAFEELKTRLTSTPIL
ncbi:hypothetical protein CR513_40247, partial [Mucuna pruriens]